MIHFQMRDIIQIPRLKIRYKYYFENNWLYRTYKMNFISLSNNVKYIRYCRVQWRITGSRIRFDQSPPLKDIMVNIRQREKQSWKQHTLHLRQILRNWYAKEKLSEKNKGSRTALRFENKILGKTRTQHNDISTTSDPKLWWN